MVLNIKQFISSTITELYILSSLTNKDFDDVNINVYDIFTNMNENILFTIGSAFDENIMIKIIELKKYLYNNKDCINTPIKLTYEYSEKYISQVFIEICKNLININTSNMPYEQFVSEIVSSIKDIYYNEKIKSKIIKDIEVDTAYFIRLSNVVENHVSKIYEEMSNIKKDNNQDVQYVLSNLGEKDLTEVVNLELNFLFFIAKVFISMNYFFELYLDTILKDLSN